MFKIRTLFMFWVVTSLLLEKWYADVVSEECLTVHYRARLGLGPFHWGYQGEMHSGSPRNGLFSRNLPQNGLPAILPSDALSLDMDAAKQALWQGVCPRPFTLWNDGNRKVVWNPVVLNATVSGSLHGRGYAERLTMDVMPWKLGLKRLWWGRFCGERHSLVWIVWEGRFPLRLALVDGVETGPLFAGEHAIHTGQFNLDMAHTEVLIEAPLGSGALARMPWPKKLAPLNFLNGIERKWFGFATLSCEGVAVDHGSVVYERVDWP